MEFGIEGEAGRLPYKDASWDQGEKERVAVSPFLWRKFLASGGEKGENSPGETQGGGSRGRPPVGEWGVEEESFFRAPPPPSRPPGGGGGGDGRRKGEEDPQAASEEGGNGGL